jgi:ribosomal protein L31E
MVGCVALWLPSLHAGDSGLVLEAVDRPSAHTSVEHALLDGMNPFVLTTLVSARLVVEIDWVEGFRPSPKAVRAIETVLARHCAADKLIEVVLDDEIPEAIWRESAGRAGLERLVARQLDGDPTAWERAEIVYVVYAPDSRPWYGESVSGMTDRITFSRADAIATVRTVLVFTDEIRRDAVLWVTPTRVERSTVVHELGHVIGLVSNPDHAQSERPDHCRVARCVMHQPGTRARFVNGLPALLAGRIPSRYGKRCSDDITTAKRLWADRAAGSPTFVDQLRAARLLRETAAVEAWRARQDRE